MATTKATITNVTAHGLSLFGHSLYVVSFAAGIPMPLLALTATPRYKAISYTVKSLGKNANGEALSP